MEKKRVDSGRRKFIKTGIVGLAGLSILPAVSKGYADTQPRETSEQGKSEQRKIVRRTVGKTGLELPIVSMGVMNADNPALVEAALDAGITHLDTAYSYQRGRNEEMIGRVIKDRPRDSYVIATKVEGDHADRRTGSFTKETKPGPFVEKFETSLTRLGLDYVDILYLHSLVRRDAVLFEPLMTAMQKLKEQGKARFIGVSTHRNEPEVIQAAVDSEVYDVVLTAYNFRQPHLKDMKESIARAAKSGVGVVAMKTQAGAFWDRERKHPINMKAALKWVLQDENVHTAIPGFTTFDQMNLDLSVMEDLALTQEEKEELRLGQKLGMMGLYCWQCDRCVGQCRENLEIPTMMRSYMYAYGYRNLAAAWETLQTVELSGAPCSNCETCTVDCPMGFDVKNRVMDIARIRDIPADFLV